MQNKKNKAEKITPEINRIKPAAVKQYREELLLKQGNKCALCGLDLPVNEAVLDHSHSTGYVRGVLHRFCNTYLGAIENNIKRNKISNTALRNILENAQQYMHTELDVLHYTYRTDEEKKARANARRARKRKAAKVESTKGSEPSKYF